MEHLGVILMWLVRKPGWRVSELYQKVRRGSKVHVSGWDGWVIVGKPCFYSGNVYAGPLGSIGWDNEGDKPFGLDATKVRPNMIV